MSKSLQRLACFGLWTVFASHETSAFAFHLDDHERVTKQAYAEFVNCFPEVGPRLELQSLVQGDLDEDLDLIVKYIWYSHFYNPHKNLNMWREGSAERIENLEPKLLQCRSSVAPWSEGDTLELGHAIHHFQDMAVPSHVVPVHHSAWDGFESYKFTGDISSEMTCSQIASLRGDQLEAILYETALTTLAAVVNYRVESVNVLTRAVAPLSGVDFWQEVTGDGFGTYGSLGNVFGSTQISYRANSLQVSENAYRQFKSQQMKTAVRATLRALSWAFPRQNLSM